MTNNKHPLQAVEEALSRLYGAALYAAKDKADYAAADKYYTTLRAYLKASEV